LTGDINRKARFGPFLENGKLTHKIFSFDSFTFPSCEKCNNDWALIESQAKIVMKNILSEKSLNCKDFNYLLTWFDKLRIGLWLSSIHMIKNFFGIQPHFYINSGAYTKDRMLLIYKNKNKINNLQTIGTNVPAFQFIPFCFSIIINNFGFINLSKHFLLAKNLGLPYTKEEYLGPNESNIGIMKNGKNKITYPLLEKIYDRNCSEIYQPLILEDHYKSYRNFYSNEYARSLFVNLQKGIGEIFYKNNTNIELYPIKDTKEWIPKKIFDLDIVDFIKLIGIQTYEFQNYYIEKVKLVGSSVKIDFGRKRRFSVAINNGNISRLRSISAVSKVK